MRTSPHASWHGRISSEYRRKEAPLSAIARKLAGMELESSTGDRVRLGSLWEQGPIVLVFIRHFG